jgi:hypothetical protein
VKILTKDPLLVPQESRNVDVHPEGSVMDIHVIFMCSYIQSKTILFKVETIVMWYSMLSEGDLNDQYDIECTIV